MKKLNMVVILAMIALIGFPYWAYGDVIYGCYQKNNGQLRIVGNTSECRKSEVPISWQGEPGPTKILVDCGNGETITDALQELGDPLTIQVKGKCNENVEIVRDDVTLIADPSGGTVNGPNSNQKTIGVMAARTVIDGLTVTGGRNGINVSGSGGSTIRNCTVQNTGRNGISFYHGGHGTVDNCTVQSNGYHGISIEAGSATVINSTISSNSGVGIFVQLGGGARIGITDSGEYAGNMISDNGNSGIIIVDSGSAYIGGNTITGNGTNPNPPFGAYGIFIVSASADLWGDNTITGNAGSGIFARSSSVKIGNPSPGLSSTNMITGNGTGSSTNIAKGGIFGEIGASLDIRNARINGNTGNGITLSTRSTARMFDDTVNNNTDNGILLAFGGGLLLQTPAVTVTGNTLFGLQCNDPESSYFGSPSGISGNTGGQVNCTGF